MGRRSAGRGGFTFIELLIAMIIIGILAAIAIPLYIGQCDRAKDASVKEGVQAIEVGVVAWALGHSDVYVADGDVTKLNWNNTPSVFSAFVNPWPDNPYTGEPCATAGTPATTPTTLRSGRTTPSPPSADRLWRSTPGCPATRSGATSCTGTTPATDSRVHSGGGRHRPSALWTGGTIGAAPCRRRP